MSKLQLYSIGDCLYPVTKSSYVTLGDSTLNAVIKNNKIVLKDIATGNNVWLQVSNGSIVINPAITYNKVLCIGNSITLHDTTAYWWGTWGMAATRKQNDWVHILQSKLQEDNENCVCAAINVANCFERGTVTDIDQCISAAQSAGLADMTDTNVAHYDAAIIRLGENDTNSSTLQSRLEALITSLVAKNASMKILITGMFWTNSTREAAIVAAANSKGITYIEIDQLDTSEYKQSVGNYVYGDDNELHEITDSGVASHPNDAGMTAIAELIYNQL